jgi:aspartate dehydrogenase
MSGERNGKLRVGLLGTGAIGQTMATAIDRGEISAVLVGVSDQDGPRAEAFVATLANRPPVVSVDELVRSSDLIVEAASQAALPTIVPKALAAGKNLLIMSVGGLLGHEDWFALAQERGCKIHVPSGAIAGLDGLKAAGRGQLRSVTLTSRKPIAALRGGKYVVERGINLDGFTESTVIFSGSPEDACRAFPATSNVAATLRLTVGTAPDVLVEVVAVPGGSANVHEIEAKGDFGRMRVVLENVPSPDNPRTSRLAALSALATLDGIVASTRVAVTPAEQLPEPVSTRA